MATQGQTQREEWCPVCKTLPLNSFDSTPEEWQLEYQIEDREVEIDQEGEKQYDQCALYSLVKSLQLAWSEKEQSSISQDRSGSILGTTCAKSGIMVLTKQRTKIEKPHASSGVSDTIEQPSCLSPSMITQLHDWISKCNKEHEGCSTDVVPLLPTRLLDVGVSVADPIIKLVETTDGERGTYIALSHCWGRSNPFITTQDNFKAMKIGFSLERAPATFRDAFEVSRKIGIRYLWIDSLCIIQGDAKDWELESSRMASIYRDATLTLSASCASADSEGFLTPRLPQCSTLKIKSVSGQSTKVYLQSPAPTPPRKNSKIQPIDTRGWCLQEMYLSRRQIMFLDDRILWSCRDFQDDSSQPVTRNVWTLAGSGTLTQTMNLLRGVTPRRHRTLNLLTPYQGWYRTVKEFTRRNLTFPSDVFPALSGLASIVAENDKGTYCAGIWLEDAAFGICWKKSSALSKVDEYIAPSWSWASVIGPVEFIDENEVYGRQTEVTLMNGVVFHDFRIQKRGANEYGQLDGAYVKLQAPLATLEKLDQGIHSIGGMQPGERVEPSFDFDRNNDVEGLSAVFLLQRLSWSWQSTSSDVILFGILVCPVPQMLEITEAHASVENVDTYARVGFFQMVTKTEKVSEFRQRFTKPLIII